MMVDCSDVLDRYSEFRDGVLEHELERAFEAHLQACSSCARYDRVVGEGVGVFRALPELSPSSDFEARLQHRLFSVEDQLNQGRRASGASLATTVGICAAITLGAWLPTVKTDSTPVRLPPVVAHSPYHYQVAPVIFQSAPIFAEAWQPEPSTSGAIGLFTRPVHGPAVAVRPVAAFYSPVR